MGIEEFLDAMVGDIGRLITGTFHLLEFILGLSYVVGETLVKWMIFIGGTLSDAAIQSWDICKFTAAELWEFGVGVVKLFLLMYHAIWMVCESFIVIITDLKTFSAHVVLTIGEQLNHTQAAVVDSTSRTFTTVPNMICQSLIFIGEQTTHFVLGLLSVAYDFSTQLVLAPINVIRTIVLMLAQLFDIPFYAYDVFYNGIPRPGKVGLIFVAVLCILYWKGSFLAIPRHLWNLVKSSYRGVFKLFHLLRNYKRIYQHALKYDGSERREKANHSDTKAVCVICQDASVQFISLPCKHVCLCHGCVKALVDVDNRCPLCRGAVTKFERVYIPL